MEDADRISNLPDAILSHILSFLGTNEAVRTSVLSTKWRYRFSLLSNLDFELYDSGRKKSKCRGFESFVDRVLFLHNTSIEKFCLKCWDNRVDSSRVCGWLSAAVWHKVQHLDLTISGGKFTTLPGVLFTSRTLVTLKIYIVGFVLSIPNHAHFPNLRTLHLKSIIISDDDAIKRLFSGCISLEEMDLEGCNFDNISIFDISHNLLKRLTIVQTRSYNYRMVIDAPMLVYFKYKHYKAVGYSIKNMQSIICADIDFYESEQVDGTSFFKGICNVQSLNLSSAISLKVCHTKGFY